MKKPRVRVSDHALLRFLERVGGVDIAAIRASIAQATDRAAQLGAYKVVIDGYRYVLREDEHGPVVVTVEKPDTVPIRRSGRRRQDREEEE